MNKKKRNKYFGILLLAAFCFSTISVISININSFNRSISDISPFKHASNNSMPLFTEQNEDEILTLDHDLTHFSVANEAFIYDGHVIHSVSSNFILYKQNHIQGLPIFILIRTFRI